jgi:hypothetical protein
VAVSIALQGQKRQGFRWNTIEWSVATEEKLKHFKSVRQVIFILFVMASFLSNTVSAKNEWLGFSWRQATLPAY